MSGLDMGSLPPSHNSLEQPNGGAPGTSPSQEASLKGAERLTSAEKAILLISQARAGELRNVCLLHLAGPRAVMRPSEM